MFDEQPDGDPHGECAAEIHRLEEALRQIGDFAHDKSTGPAVPDALWEVRSMAYDAIRAHGVTPCQTEQECEAPDLCSVTNGCERMEPPTRGVTTGVEPPDDCELEAWRHAGDALLSHQPPANYEIRRAAMLLQNAYLFARKLRDARGVGIPDGGDRG